MTLKKIGIASAIALIITGCQTTLPTKLKYNKTEHTNANQTFVYTPENREEFVFAQISPKLQKYAYKDICFKRPQRSVYSECSSNQLNYSSYVGKRGYYTDQSSSEDIHGHIIREAILETGEVVYMVKSKKYKHVGDNIISLKDHLAIASFKPKPIVDGSKVLITGYSKISRGNLSVSSQEKHSYTPKNIDLIKKIAKSHPEDQGRIADLLSTLQIKHDDIEDETTIKGMPYNNKESSVSLKLNLDSSGKVTPWITANYTADSWLFINSLIIAADELRWKSPKSDFKRDHSSGTIWEWSVFYLNSDSLKALSKLASAKKPVIRFKGRDYYDDYTLTPIQQKELSALIELNSLLQG